MTEKNLDKLLNFDAVDTAEKMGEFVDTDKASLAFHLINSSQKREALLAAGDTEFSNKVDRYISILENTLGMEKVFEKAFEGHNGVMETQFVFARRDGILLHFDTCSYKKEDGTINVSVNASNVYLNVRPTNGLYTQYPEGRWSGSTIYDNTRINYLGYSISSDAREALVYKLNCLIDYEILGRWLERPFLWLLTYMDTKTENFNYEEINNKVISQLPEWVQTMITPAVDSDTDFNIEDKIFTKEVFSFPETRTLLKLGFKFVYNYFDSFDAKQWFAVYANAATGLLIIVEIAKDAVDIANLKVIFQTDQDVILAGEGCINRDFSLTKEGNWTYQFIFSSKSLDDLSFMIKGFTSNRSWDNKINLWLLTPLEGKKPYFEELNAARIAALPQATKTMLSR